MLVAIERYMKMRNAVVVPSKGSTGSYCAPQVSKGSNGIVERAVQSVEQSLTTLKSSLDEWMGVKIDVLPLMLTWLCELVGYTMNRMEEASDGKTPYERVNGKRSEVMGFGVLRVGAMDMSPR